MNCLLSAKDCDVIIMLDASLIIMGDMLAHSVHVIALWAWPRFSANSSAPIRRIKNGLREKSRTSRVL